MNVEQARDLAVRARNEVKNSKIQVDQLQIALNRAKENVRNSTSIFNSIDVFLVKNDPDYRPEHEEVRYGQGDPPECRWCPVGVYTPDYRENPEWHNPCSRQYLKESLQSSQRSDSVISCLRRL